ncbi:hypothetical protein [Cellulomonas sp. HZM]|uniref:WDGH domain-containing protein n=1 Tax=Cellulomonas sp. HZM TaxID=1454010 RepID=UPI000493287B|nr:hypothetical protein [Cellulomonas sp. HZM]
MTDQQREAVARALTEHQWAADDKGLCSCGWEPDEYGDCDVPEQWDEWTREFVAHQTDALAALAPVCGHPNHGADDHSCIPFLPPIPVQPDGDEHHTMDELYEYRMLYNAHAAHGWLAAGVPVVKSWQHSDGEPCFGGGWFIVVATLPTGQVSNHYAAEFWDLFTVPAVDLPPEYDGHTPQVAAGRLRDALATPVRPDPARILPDPTAGCCCIWHDQDAGGGYTETVVEYEPACPEHSEHLYDPRTGTWVLQPDPLRAGVEALADEYDDRTRDRVARLAPDVVAARLRDLLAETEVPRG